MKISKISAFKSLSSLGNETLKVSLILDDTKNSSVTVLAGISAGKYEAKPVLPELAVDQVNELSGFLTGKDWTQETLDALLIDKKLGGNTSIAISAAFWKAKPKILDEKIFPKLLLLLFEGAKHGNPNLTIQEFMIVENSLQTAINDSKKMREYLSSQGIETTVGAEGGFSPMNFTNLLVLELLKSIFPKYEFALDAAGSFRETGVDWDKFIASYNLLYIEDPFSDEDWTNWQNLMTKFGSKLLIVGDDLTTTNPERIRLAIENKAINAVIIKPNQNGTISGTLDAVNIAKKSGLKIIVSHRGEESDDDWLVDFAISVKADYVKFGGIDRGERIAKYNRLLELGMP